MRSFSPRGEKVGIRGCLSKFDRCEHAESPPHPALRADLSPQARGEVRKKAGIAPGFLFCIPRTGPGAAKRRKRRIASGTQRSQFNDARFGGVAGHDLISVS